MASLLAVDLGLRTGLALYGGDGRLRWYRSQNFGTRARLKRGAYGVLSDLTDCKIVVMEGGGDLARPWEQAARRLDIATCQISAERWRDRLLSPSQRRGTAVAKASADDVARQMIEWSGTEAPTSLRHDAAEAILIGLWGVLAAGWLDDVPAPVRTA